MAELYIKGTWKGKGKKVSKTSSPMIGMIYTAQYKDREILGVLVHIGVTAFIRTKDNRLFSVDRNSLKIVA